MMFRTRREQLAYDRMKKADGCPFCVLDDPKLNPKPRRVLKETKHFRIMEAMYPYSFWEHIPVLEQWMIVPKRHVGALEGLSPTERKEFTDLFFEFEAKGYSVYARAPQNVSRTLSHAHVHLIKLGSKKPRLVFATRKPYIMITV